MNLKRSIIIPFLLLATASYAGIHSYTDHSVLSKGTFVKISVPESGIYCLTYDDIANIGLNPQQIRVLGYGGTLLSPNFTLEKIDDVPSIPFYMSTGDDGVFNKNDYILFYAHGPVNWSYNGTRFVHQRNFFSDSAYYFLSDNAGEQILLDTDSILNSTNAFRVTSYSNYQLHEKDIYNLIDAAQSVSGGGREWYGERFEPNGKQKFTFTFPDICHDQKMLCRIDLAAKSSEIANFTAKIGDKTTVINLPSIKSNDFTTMATTYTQNIVSINPISGSKQTVELTYNAPSSALGYLNWIELTARCALKWNGNALYFRDESHYPNLVNSLYCITGADHNVQVWDVTSKTQMTRMQTRFERDTLFFVGDNQEIHEYVAIRPNSTEFPKPVVCGKIANQDLHKYKDIDYVIITPEICKNASIRLAKAHEQMDGLSWAVVTDQEIYNEFSSGTPDASAYRWFMKMLYDRADSINHAPKNLLLMGDGSYDNRNLSIASGYKLLLTYPAQNSVDESKAYSTDDYFGFLEDNDGVSGNEFYDIRGRMRIGVGRLPVRNAEQAEQVVDKIINYMQDKLHGKWKQQMCFLADDGNNGMHTTYSDIVAEDVRVNNPNFIVNKIYLDAYVQETSASGETYPSAYNRFTNLLQNGVLYMNYSGHGSANNICNEGFLYLADVKKMSNRHLGMWMLASCSFSHYDGGSTSSGEEAVLNPNGGAIGVLSSCRTVYASQNAVLNKHFCDTLFGHSNRFHYNMTIGDATRIAKNMTGNDDNKMAYILLGDPAVKLLYPTQYNVATVTRLDTLHALSTATLQGYIQTEDTDAIYGDTAVWFNGKLMITVFDKLQKTTTRDNDELDENKKKRITFNDYPNTIFNGSADVKNGKFSITFMLPKDIRYNYGNGRITYYAFDTDNGDEACGYYEDFVIGGSAPVFNNDSTGPDITLYLNNPSFVNGEKTHETPRFFADIYDKDGINTAGSGIGHDLLIVVDQDIKQTYVVNEYFTAENNSYQSGQVSYLFSELSEGHHRLTFRAWDMLNNSSTEELEFDVVKGMKPVFFNILVYPNPVRHNESVRIHANYDQPDNSITATLNIYDLCGHPVFSQTQDATQDFVVDLNQHHMSPGTYIYNILLQSVTSDPVRKAGKLMVL